jgi:hypothetical protein
MLYIFHLWQRSNYEDDDNSDLYPHHVMVAAPTATEAHLKADAAYGSECMYVDPSPVIILDPTTLETSVIKLDHRWREDSDVTTVTPAMLAATEKRQARRQKRTKAKARVPPKP